MRALPTAPAHAAVILLSVAVLCPAQPRAAPVYPKGYLPHLEVQSLASILPAAPAVGDARDNADRALFQATRSSENTPRWTLAQRDNDLSVAGLLRSFGCAFGPATAENSPHLAHLLGRVSSDSFNVFGALKNQYKRRRPFLMDQGPTCIDRATLRNSFDYPSGHSTLGYATGLILAELDPGNAPAILTRAREYGESRIFCGVHNNSAVEAGRMAAASLVAMLHSSREFEKDLKAARKDAEKLHRSPPQPAAACAAEDRTLSVSPYAGLAKR